MQIHVLSDLHLEFGDLDANWQPPICDLMIVAGDLHPKLGGLRWLLKRIPAKLPVLYVMGNHEFYGEKHPHLIQKLKSEAKGSSIHILENECIEFEGYHFFGATLWTDMNLYGTPDISCHDAIQMNDYMRIRLSTTSFRKLKPKDTRLLHSETLFKLKQWLEAHDSQQSIIITHHAPSPQSLPIDWRDHSIYAAYASNLEPFILEHNPRLWIHGHLHNSQHYQIGQTHIIANPRGYTDELNPNFNPSLIVNIKSLTPPTA